MTERLTTLAAVKDWLGIPADSDTSDAGLLRVLNAASQFILGYLNRDSLTPKVYNEHFRGNGKESTLLRNWPVRSVSSVGVGSTNILASASTNVAMPANGYVLGDARQSAQSLDLFGYRFYYRVPCLVVYEAGYGQIETTVVELQPDTSPDVVVPWTPVNGQWVSNISVKEGDTLYTQMPTAVDLTTGQYYVDQWGTYTFSTFDGGKTLSVDYGFAPWDMAFAVTEIIGEWYRRKEHIGVLSKTLGGQETVTFSSQDISDVAATTLQQYRNVVPI